MTTTTFRSDFLASPASINRFLSGNDEAAAIARAGPSSSTELNGHTWGADLDGLYFWVSGLVLTIGSYFLHAICMSDFSKKVWVQSRHALNNVSAIKAEKVFQNHLLSKSINTHRLDSADHYLLPTMSTALSTHTTPGMLNSFHADGICRGMSHWFIHLYFKTRRSFSNIELQLAAVGKQFEQGAPAQAVLLHSLEPSSICDLLKLNVHRDYSKISTTGKTEEQIIDHIRFRPVGVYGIYTSSHQVVYIKIDESNHYLFDPNVGVVKVSSAALFKTAMENYLQSHDPSKDIYIDQYTPK